MNRKPYVISPEQQKVYNKRYYDKHKETLRQAAKAYYWKTKESRKVERATNKRKSRIKNRDKIAAWNKEYYNNHKDSYYRLGVSYKYGLTPEDYVELVKRANGHCQICGKLFKNSMDCCVDHDHVSDKVRGLLCRNCNIHLGWFEQHGKSAIEYLANSTKT